MSRLQVLRLVVQQRLTAAAEDIFGVFVKTIEEYEEELGRHRRLLADVMKRESSKPDPPQLLDYKDEVPAVKQEWSPSLDQEEPEPPHVKDEEEELWRSQDEEQLQELGEADITKFPFTPAPVKSENDDENAQSSQLLQNQTDDYSKAEPPANTSRKQMKTEPDGEDCALSESASNPGQDSGLQLTNYFGWNKTSESSGMDSTEGTKKIIPQRSTKKKAVSCPVCGKGFSDRGHMQTHMRTHTGEKPFSCSICGKRFSQRGDVQRHIRIHTGEKPFSCSVCGKRFSDTGHMRRHMRIHTGEKPFRCSICGKGFSVRGHVQRHVKIHTEGKPFGCQAYAEGFSQKS